MLVNLLALCGDPGDSIVKRVRTSAGVQEQLDGYFQALETTFRDGVEVERAYDSRWTPGSDEVITLPVNAEVEALMSRLDAGTLALDEINGSSFEEERIRALLVRVGEGPSAKLLIQVFSLAQRLSRKMAFIANGNTFNKIDQSAFALSSHIEVIVEGGLIKFKNYNVAKRIFDLSSYYKEATDAEIRKFASSSTLMVDAEALVTLATQPIRKLISSVQASGVLDRETADSIRQKASGLVAVTVQNDKVVVPLTRPELKDLMAFLDHKIYKSPVDDDPYETNSHRRRG